MLYTCIFIYTSFPSIITDLSPLRTLLPTVPGIQYPGIIIAFFGSGAHSLKVYNERPPCNMPGVAKNTIGLSVFIDYVSNF